MYLPISPKALSPKNSIIAKEKSLEKIQDFSEKITAEDGT